MYIKFRQLKWRNFLSYGNKETIFDFTPGLNLLSGQNGEGKSSILGVLTFVLFGKPYSDIKMYDLLNWRNKKKLYTECIFDIGTDNYKIIRTMKLDTLKIFKNDQDLELLSSKMLNQDEIDKILGINYKLFKQILCISSTSNKPFLKCCAEDKRDIIESIFNVKIFGIMLKSLKKKITTLKITIDSDNKVLKILEEGLKVQNKSLKDIKNTEKTFEDQKNTEISEIKSHINATINDQGRVADNLCSLKDYEKSTYTSYLNEDQQLVTKIAIIKQNITQIINKINFFNKNNVCPECDELITNDKKVNKLQECDNKLTKYKEELKELLEKDQLLKEKILSYKSKLDEKEKHQNKLETINDKIVELNKQLERIKARKFNFNIQEMEKKFTDKCDEYRKLSKDNKNNNEKMISYKIMQDILGDEGVKKYFYSKLTPILNQKINGYLNKFELPVVLKFDEKMDEKIYNISNLRNETIYESYSGGERKRLDLSILFSFCDMTKLISSWNSNILFLDEVLDGELDEAGISKMIENLNSFVHDFKDLSIYLISHRITDKDLFDKVIEIKKENGFSEICI
jgi:DNA repair exonuclease SbcCD ATPase subunit